MRYLIFHQTKSVSLERKERRNNQSSPQDIPEDIIPEDINTWRRRMLWGLMPWRIRNDRNHISQLVIFRNDHNKVLCNKHMHILHRIWSESHSPYWVKYINVSNEFPTYPTFANRRGRAYQLSHATESSERRVTTSKTTMSNPFRVPTRCVRVVFVLVAFRTACKHKRQIIRWQTNAPRVENIFKYVGAIYPIIIMLIL